jgi:hypothetical protein
MTPTGLAVAVLGGVPVEEVLNIGTEGAPVLVGQPFELSLKGRMDPQIDLRAAAGQLHDRTNSQPSTIMVTRRLKSSGSGVRAPVMAAT